MRQFPSAFEFNEEMLLAIMDNLHSCRFGTFMFNCESERIKHQLPQRTMSIWTAINANVHRFRNVHFVQHKGALFPSFSPKNIKLWRAYWLRHDPSALPASPHSKTFFF
jgi:hypothetical protein